MTEVTLTPSQSAAFADIVAALPTRRIVLLQGSAGTGKTTLTKYIVEHLYDFGTYSICAIAPTHKARRVIAQVLNMDAVIPITTFTIASALSKIREHSYVGTKLYGQSNVKKLSSYNLFLVDEVSMISDADMRTLLNYVATANKQVLLIGDNNQIPCPNAGFYKPCNPATGELEGYIQKCDSYVFTDPTIHKVVLTDIVRQAEGSPIIRLANYIRAHINDDIAMNAVISDASTAGNEIIALSNIHERYCELWAESPSTPPRVIAYTNAAVRTHNLEIRSRLYPDAAAPYIVGDILMGYNAAGIADVIENGQDYTVVNVLPTAGYKVGEFTGLAGWLLELRPCEAPPDSPPIRGVFCINIYKGANKAYLNDIIRRAQRVNEVGSHKTTWRDYQELKQPVIFIDDVYKYDGKIFTDTTLRETHPLLFTNVGELVRGSPPEKIQSVLATAIEKAYPGLIDDRIADIQGKLLSDSEQLADRYKVIDRDLFYGYAITAHKSQGSTYGAVIVDEPDFQKLVNRWNCRHGCLESRVREKNQLRYVAYTRARNVLCIASGDDDICTK